MNRIGAAALMVIGLVFAGLGLATGPATAEMSDYLTDAKTLPEAIRQAKQVYKARLSLIENLRKDARKEFRQAFIACKGNDACEDAAEAARDRRYEELGAEKDMAIARLGSDREAIRKHFMRPDKPPAGTVAKPK